MTHGNMFEYDLKDNTWKTHSACLEKVPKTQRNTINKVGGYAVDEQRLWITLENSHCIIEFDMDTRKYQYHALGEANMVIVRLHATGMICGWQKCIVGI